MTTNSVDKHVKYTIELADLSQHGINGQCDYKNKHIMIDNSPNIRISKQLYVAIHELTHAYWYERVEKIQSMISDTLTENDPTYLAEVVAKFNERYAIHIIQAQEEVQHDLILAKKKSIEVWVWE